MKIGVSTLAINDKNISKNLEFLEGLNIEYIEILNEFPNNIIDSDLLNSYNFKYTVHSPIIDLNMASLNTNVQKTAINEVEKAIDLACKIDSDIVVVHPGEFSFLAKPYEEKVLANCRESLIICRNYGSNVGVNIAIENMPNIEGFLYKDIYKLNDLAIDIDIDMTLDVAHAATNGFLENEMYFDSIKHIHLSDNNYDYDSHYALGEGSIDFNLIINTFKKNNYDGVYVIEVNDKESITKSIDFLKNI